ncbi:MAG: A/G-specific adenine glycosylase [Bacteroidota bacterium]|nr:A/G-specific adenine glycosylase [Bacteroidota bacterium]
MQIDFTKKLLEWDRNCNVRSMPWKGESSPYKIWLSEIILQQTRVEQGTAYYKKFINLFPDIRFLAGATEKEIFKCWEGLGYYNRCRNLIATARKINQEYHGSFPSSYEEILALPGIGPYTAAAIASFAFGLPYAVVDGNVERVLARYFGISTMIGSTSGKRLFSALAGSLLHKKDPALYNQAIMDFGATVCKPRNPLCSECVLARQCQAFQNGWTNLLPLKKQAPPRTNRWFYYFVVSAGKDKVWIRERKENDIWQNLFEFVLWESGKIMPQDELCQTPFFKDQFGKKNFRISYVSEGSRQILTHQSITGYFIHLDRPMADLPGYQPISHNILREFAFPKLITNYISSSPRF